jgi:uncharacterized phage protein (TIGR02216 family)
MHAGFCLLRLSSKDFWALTPLELSAMTGAMRPRGQVLRRERLEALMETFPDETALHP